MKSFFARVATCLFFSGACALVYQVAWFRELRLVFGGSTAASSAVLAIFMGGLGLGGWLIGRRADRSKNPLAIYANLELGVSVAAGASPLLVGLARLVYVGLGGVATLGVTGATIVRLLLTIIVLGPATVAMGGTMPAAARAVEQAANLGRQRVALLYGINTIGAVAGTIAANFFLLEVFGTEMTLWLACLVNALVSVAARVFARAAPVVEPESTEEQAEEPTGERPLPAPWFPPIAAGAAGLAFMVMELVWYRMLAPLLGGTTYTFGLILAVALAGIGIGGALYSARKRPATLALFAITCLLEALAIAIPFALGDRVAVLAFVLSPLAHSSFLGGATAWTALTFLVVFPAAIISGFQFPAIIGLYGRGAKNVGAHVGRAYVANTIGSIVGALASGFGLMPLLGALGCWKLVVFLLVVTGIVALAADARAEWQAGRGPFVISGILGGAALAAVMMTAGPTAAWRHSGIGANRTGSGNSYDRKTVAQFINRWRTTLAWEADGVESDVALYQQNGYAFVVNGKSDGNVYSDRATQVMSGLLAVLIHGGEPKRALVVGLGTGSTAGWLGQVASLERVDVMELESVILRIARECSPVNEDVLSNPKVHIQLNDAREGLITTRERYDVVFSEPSNPYRAGVSSLYTMEYYRAIAERLAPDGVFAQWIQTYDVDPFVIGTAMTTIHSVFPNVTIWQMTSGDLVLVGQKSAHPLDFNWMRAKLATEPFASAALVAWDTASLEGVLSHFVGDRAFVDAVVANHTGVVNVDDQNLLEFSFARNVGTQSELDRDIARATRRTHHNVAEGVGDIDGRLVEEELLLYQGSGTLSKHGETRFSRETAGFMKALANFERESWREGVRDWDKLGRGQPHAHQERVYLARGLAETADPRFSEFAAELKRTVDRDYLTALWLIRSKRVPEAVDILERAFVATRKDPWVDSNLLGAMLRETTVVATTVAPDVRKRLATVLLEPFAVGREHVLRIAVGLALASHSDDAPFCVKFIDRAGPVPLDEAVMRNIAGCFQTAGDPRAAQAIEDLQAVLALTPVFGAELRDPAAPTLTAPPKPSVSAD